MPLALSFVVLLVLYYVGSPLLIKLIQRMPSRPTFVPLDLRQLNPRVAQFLQETARVLGTDGFSVSTCAGMPYQASSVAVHLVMLVNPATGDQAMVTAMASTDPLSPWIRTHYLEFITRFADGHCVDTMNSKTLSAFPPWPGNIRTQTPTVLDPRELYRLHRFVIERTGPHGSPVLYSEGQGIPHLASVMVADYERQVQRGWLELTPAGDAYVMTLKGAYLMTWGLQWPMSMIRRMNMNRRAREAVAEFRASGSAMQAR